MGAGEILAVLRHPGTGRGTAEADGGACSG